MAFISSTVFHRDSMSFVIAVSGHNDLATTWNNVLQQTDTGLQDAG